ncbi:hypothetical protein KIH41_08460 [Litoribacter ruber]|uniref:Uncharacterized protein n=2 Tax=Litoribacter ruber TaxID=702568 RepID=A0AAP2G4I6_9BACT|nr:MULTISPECIES: hypothetical protein [Litoribacter]MBS9524106.1 hypothetical protein [Litoribacter alkaliphilus]MBT0811310.1 hypothetical protein [Litoribacter ruber]
MSEAEFDLMDELYFVQSYAYLKEAMGWDDEQLLAILQKLYGKGYIKCMTEPDSEIFDKADILKAGRDYYYLATKKGLMYHNTRE